MSRNKWILVGLGVIGLWIMLGLFPIIVTNDWIERGQCGDMFGLANSFFSGVAFVGVIIAIYLQMKQLEYQKEELKLQREELRLTRDELKRSAEAQEKSEEALRKQAASLKITAKINALATLLEIKENEINRMQRQGVIDHPNSLKNLKIEKINLIRTLEDIYDDKA